MSASNPGDYLVTVEGPGGERWAWFGYADNVGDALALAGLWRQDQATKTGADGK